MSTQDNCLKQRIDLFNSITDSSTIKGGHKLKDRYIYRKAYLLFKVQVNILADIFAFGRHAGSSEEKI